MSVICWDGKRVAADRQGCIGDTPIISPKLFKVGNRVFGCSGMSAIKFAFKEWVEKGCPADDKPLLEGNFGIILINKKVCWYYGEKELYPTEITEPFWAVGSGADYALGAMAMGADAIKAVEIACKFDVYCGGGVDSFDVMI